MNDRQRSLNELLHYGFFIGGPYEVPQLPFSQATLEAARDDRRALAELDDKALCAHGIRVWKRVCRRLLESRNGPFILPLSAGLDSRAVLAGLVDQGASQLRTVTYGVPGSFDYEIAPQVSRQACTPNDRIDLSGVTVDIDRIDAIPHEPGRMSFLMDMYFNRVISDRYGSEYTYLSGYIGDVLAGKNLGGDTSADWHEARQRFASRNRHSRTVTLTDSGVDPAALLPAEPWVSPELMSFDEQLGYAVRQECLMRPIVMRSDYDSIAPMLDPEWATFMLALSDAQRRERRLFSQMFQQGFPALFELPTTANGGLPLTASARAVRSHKRRLKRRRRLRARLNRLFPSIDVPLGNRGWQYIDFERGLSERHDLVALFDRSMRRLDQQGLVPWVDATALLQAHRNGDANHGKALGVLLNLDIISNERQLAFPPAG